MLMDSAKLASFAHFADFARPAQLIGVLVHAVWTVERYIHSCIAGCHARDILGTYSAYWARFCASRMPSMCRGCGLTTEKPVQLTNPARSQQPLSARLPS